MARGEETRELCSEILDSWDARVKGIATMKKETVATLKDLRVSRERMSSGLKRDLAEGEAERKRIFEALLADIQNRGQERKAEVQTLLQDLQASHENMARQLREMLDRVTAEQREMASDWRKLSETMQRRRAGIPPKVVLPKEKVPEEKKVEIAEEVKVTEVEEVVKEAPSEMAIEERVLSIINNYPNGIRLVDIEEVTGEARIKLGNVIRGLRDQGKVRKESKLYFPISST